MRPPPTAAEGWCLANSNKVQRATKGREIYRNDGTAAWKWDADSIVFNPARQDHGQHRGAQQYTFSQLWGMHVQTTQVYQEVGLPIVRRVFEGYNGCIMAYGQTNSGKTHTISGTGSSVGLIALAVNDFFDHIRATPDRVSLLRVSFLEVYNEQLKDLLADEQPTLIITDDNEGRVKVGNVTETVVGCLDDVKQLAAKGEARRMFGRNNVHEHASRSHTIFQLIFESRHVDEAMVRVSTLNVVDLAGSEHTSLPMDFSRMSDKKKDPEQRALLETREREGNNIRKSLLALGRVVSALATGPKEHIPYRDSKLTRILRPALGGNSSTVIIATINPWMSDTDDKETNATLRFAFTAQQISNTPYRVALSKDDGLLDYYQNELRELQTQMLLANTERLGAFQENKKLASEVEAQEAKRAALLQKYNNLSKFILTSKSEGLQAEPAERDTQSNARPGLRRCNSLESMLDRKKTAADGRAGGAGQGKACADCPLKDAMVASLQRQARAATAAVAQSAEIAESASEKESELLVTLEQRNKLQEQADQLEAAKQQLEDEVQLKIRELAEKEGTLKEAQHAVDGKVKEIGAKQKELRAAQAATVRLEGKIAAQEQENNELEADLKALCGEKIAFERYYEHKKRNRKFSSVRKLFEKDKPQEYKPWLQHLPSEGTVERSMSTSNVRVQLPPASLPRSGHSAASLRSRSGV